MTAGANPFFGPMQFYQQQAFPGLSGQPIRRMQLTPVNTLGPDFQGMGLGGFGMPAMFGYQMLQQQMANRPGMMLGPGGGSSATSFFRAQRQFADIQRLSSMSNQNDSARIRQLISAFTSAAYRGEDASKVNALTGSMTKDFVSLLNTGILQGLGLEDYLAPGGLSSSFATRMYTAGLRNRQAPGRMGLSLDQVTDITNQLRGRMFKGGKEQFDFTRGFNMREFGEMSEGLAQRGVLDFSKDRGRMLNQFKNLAGAMDALKDLIGRPDAPVAELMQTLDDMFGGNGLASIPAARMEMMVRQAEAMGHVMNLTSTQLQEVFKGASLQARGLGMNGELGALAAMRAMPMSEAAQSMAEDRLRGLPQDNRIRLGMLSPEQRMQNTQTMLLRATNSQFSDRVAAAIQMQEIKGGSLGNTPELGRMNNILNKVKSGQALTTEEGSWIHAQLREGGIGRLGQAAGLDSATVTALMRDKLSLNETKANYDFTALHSVAVRDDLNKIMASKLQSQDFQAFLGMGGMTQDARVSASTGFLNWALKGDVSREGLMARLGSDPVMRARISAGAKARGISEAQMRKEIVAQTIGVARGTLDKSMFGERSLEEYANTFSDEALARTRANSLAAMQEAKFNQGMSRAGFGTTRGGGAGMMDAFLRAVAEGGPGAKLGDIAAQTIGGVPTERLLAGLNSPEAKDNMTKMQQLTAQMKEQSKKIAESSGEQRENAEKQLVVLEKELATRKEILQTYEGYLNLGSSNLATAKGAEASELGALIESGDKVSLVRALKGYASGDMLAAANEAGVLNEEDKKKYLGAAGDIQRIASEALKAGGDPLAAATRIMNLQRQQEAMATAQANADPEPARLEQERELKAQAMAKAAANEAANTQPAAPLADTATTRGLAPPQSTKAKIKVTDAVTGRQFSEGVLQLQINKSFGDMQNRG